MKMQTPATSADTVPDPADIAIAQAEARQCHRRRWLIVGGVASLIVSYPLSFGTVFFLARKELLPDAVLPVVALIYSPIVYLINYVPTVERVFRCYLWSLGIDL